MGKKDHFYTFFTSMRFSQNHPKYIFSFKNQARNMAFGPDMQKYRA